MPSRARDDGAAPQRMLIIHQEPDGGRVARRLLSSFDARIERVASAAEAVIALAVLSRGALAAGAPSQLQLESVLRLNVPLLFVHSVEEGWEFYGAEHQAASRAVRDAIAGSESMAMRAVDYEHAAMVDELLRRCRREVRRARAAGAAPAPPGPMTHHAT